MNQIARPIPVATQPQVAAARQVASGSLGRNVASVDSSAVEELNPTVGAYYYYGDEGLLFRDDGNDLADNRRGYKDEFSAPLFNGTGLDAPSTVFAAFFENNQATGDQVSATEFGGDAKYPVEVSRVIDRYETNARIIAGTEASRGESLNLNL